MAFASILKFDDFISSLTPQLRTQNALPPVLGFLVGYMFYQSMSIDSRSLFFGGLAAILFSFAATIQNDLADYQIDRYGKRSSPLLDGTITVSQLRITMVILFFMATLAAMATSNIYTFGLLLVSALLAWQYNRPPIQASKRPLASIILLGILLSALPIASGASLNSATYSPSILIFIFGYLLHRISISMLKDYKDYSADKHFSKNTFLIRFGHHTTINASLVLSVIGPAIILLSLLSKITTTLSIILAVILTLLAIYQSAERLYFNSRQSQFSTNNKIFIHLFIISVLFDAGVLLCLYIS